MFALIYALLSIAPQASAAPTLSVFEFKGVRAGEPVQHSLLKSCRALKDGTIACEPLTPQVAGISNYGTAPELHFYQARLTSMYYVVDRRHYLTLLSAFVTKYGQPCQVSKVEWRNAMGAVFPSQVVRWCFASGKLELREMTSNRDISAAVYQDVYQAPAPPARIDF
jgi:hypothetical protein